MLILTTRYGRPLHVHTTNCWHVSRTTVRPDIYGSREVTVAEARREGWLRCLVCIP